MQKVSLSASQLPKRAIRDSFYLVRNNLYLRAYHLVLVESND